MFGGGAVADEDSETIVEKKEAAASTPVATREDKPKQQISFGDDEDAFQ